MPRPTDMTSEPTTGHTPVVGFAVGATKTAATPDGKAVSVVDNGDSAQLIEDGVTFDMPTALLARELAEARCFKRRIEAGGDKTKLTTALDWK